MNDQENGLTSHGGPDLLDSWKEIAEYLRVHPRTAQRMFKAEGLPVYSEGKRGSRVWAYKSEIDAWRTNMEKTATSAPPGPDVPVPTEVPVSRAHRFGFLVLAVFTLVTLTLTSSVPVRPNSEWQVPDRVFARAEAEGGRIRVSQGRPYPVRLRMSPDNSQIYVLTNFGPSEIEVLDAGTLQLTKTFKTPGGAAFFNFDPSGRTLGVGTVSNGLLLIDRFTGQATVVRDGIDGPVRHFVFAPDGATVYFAVVGLGVRRYDIRTRQVTAIRNDLCPYALALDADNNRLFVSGSCGPGQTTAHDTIEMLDSRTGETLRTFKGPPMVATEFYLFPKRDRLWTSGADACQNPEYQRFGADCPVWPGLIANIFRISDGAVVKVFGGGETDYLRDPLFIGDGTRVITSGKPARVLDTARYLERERLIYGIGEATIPVLDKKRRRVYIADYERARIYGIDLPERDCDPDALGRFALWTGDGTLNEVRSHVSLQADGQVAFAPGLVGRAFDLRGGSVFARSRYDGINYASNTDGSLSMWVHPQGAGVVVRFGADGKELNSLSLDEERRLVFTQVGREPVQGMSPLAKDSWSHLAVTARGNALAVLVNGNVELHTSRSPEIVAPVPAMRELRFGPVDGFIDEIATYDHPLTKDELQKLIKTAKTCLTSQAP